MRVGTGREIKNHEYRVGLPTLLSSLWNAPHGVRSCRRNLRVGRPVWVGLFYSFPAIGANPEAILPITSH